MIGTVLLLPVAFADDPDPHHGEALLVDRSGEVEVTVRGETTPAAPGAHLPQGATVCTRAGAFATLRLARGDRAHDEVILFSQTCTTIDHLDARGDAQAASRSSRLSLRQGSVAVRSDAGPDVEVEIVTESGQTSGAEGGFRVTIEEAAARTEAVTGAVVVRGAGAEVDVPAGYGSRTRTGEPPSPPIALLVSAEGLIPDDAAILTRPDFGWSAVDRALGYRVEIASDRSFSALLVAEEVAEPWWKPDLLFLPFRVGGLWWRVAAFDRTGFVGFPSTPHRVALPAGVGP